MPSEPSDSPASGPTRRPATPREPTDLDDLAGLMLEEAGGRDAGRAARTLTPGSGARLKQTVLAVRAGRRLQEHTTPGPATIQVLRGTAVVGLPDGQQTVPAGSWMVIPDQPHDLEAVGDTAVLLTVAPAGRQGEAG